MKSNKKLESYFDKFNDGEDLVLTINVCGEMNFHLKNMFKNDTKLSQDFLNQLYKIIPISEELENRWYFHVKPEDWIPKVDEFTVLFEKFYS